MSLEATMQYKSLTSTCTQDNVRGCCTAQPQSGAEDVLNFLHRSSVVTSAAVLSRYGSWNYAQESGFVRRLSA